ncbi:winged helix DNA-binding protein [Anaerococcus sp. AGMB00486]|uniref:Winged helix DNA-binding protein n=2 Tax=Anaerococcus TaxID=165779 RepID=A0ABX2N9P2_9FIRM|nr:MULTISPECIES: winged helix DNA-binding protein [Anaerococcus]MDY3007377.1 winged helix DNA-binding protein [Anaerococcus porci]MSS78323.1 winged helix DNA-binding protein [Anaerococcus porci]NVF11437.1 winged helix DNA-binding protein [Anaerococcus faecalis]
MYNNLEKIFDEVYEKFKLNLYKNMFANLQDREATLTATETFTIEVIHALNRPRVSDVTEFLECSHPNIAYKISALIKKGYLKKIQSEEDRREYYLECTEKFYEYYNMKNSYIELVLDRLRKRVDKKDIETMEKILEIMSDELMPEVTKFINSRKNEDSNGKES